MRARTEAARRTSIESDAARPALGLRETPSRRRPRAMRVDCFFYSFWMAPEDLAKFACADGRSAAIAIGAA